MGDVPILEPQAMPHPLALVKQRPSDASQAEGAPVSVLASLMESGGLHSVFQPIGVLSDGQVYGHEALIRGPEGHALQGADALLQAARQEDVLHRFEWFALGVALESWQALKQPGRLFLNISADVLVDKLQRRSAADWAERVRALGLAPRMLVLEITEHDRVTDMGALAKVVEALREHGVLFALDDFGDGRSSLRLWSQIKPDIVKVDKYFTRDISRHAENLQTIRALMQIAEVFHAELVAEGIETAEDLRMLRDLGIRYGQGYFLGRPDRAPRNALDAGALKAFDDQRLVVFPELKRAPSSGRLRPFNVIEAPTATRKTSNDDLVKLFLRHPEVHAIALLDGDTPIALVNRQQFMNRVAQPYFKEIFGRSPCLELANHAPRMIEESHDVDELLGILTSADQRYLTEGFIITRNGRYLGLGTGDQLVRSVTEVRIEAARHANPLTFLPGNIPISQHIERLLQRRGPFVASYADLNSFKPFNDQYGYWRGDEMIRLLARACVNHCDPRNDFVGHVGGDDFVMLFQSADWEERCRKIVEDFDARAVLLYDDAARAEGGIHAEDRHGVARFFPFTTLSIGAVAVTPGHYKSAEDVANAAAQAKHAAKVGGLGLAVR